MVVDSCRRNPYMTCLEEPVEGEDFCAPHLEYILRAEAELDRLFKKEPA